MSFNAYGSFHACTILALKLGAARYTATTISFASTFPLRTSTIITVQTAHAVFIVVARITFVARIKNSAGLVIHAKSIKVVKRIIFYLFQGVGYCVLNIRSSQICGTRHQDSEEEQEHCTSLDGLHC